MHTSRVLKPQMYDTDSRTRVVSLLMKSRVIIWKFKLLELTFESTTVAKQIAIQMKAYVCL